MIKLNLHFFGGNGSSDGLVADKYETKLSREIGRKSQIKPNQNFVVYDYNKDERKKATGEYLLEQISKKKLRKQQGSWRSAKGFLSIRRIEKKRKR